MNSVHNQVDSMQLVDTNYEFSTQLGGTQFTDISYGFWDIIYYYKL